MCVPWAGCTSISCQTGILVTVNCPSSFFLRVWLYASWLVERSPIQSYLGLGVTLAVYEQIHIWMRVWGACLFLECVELGRHLCIRRCRCIWLWWWSASLSRPIINLGVIFVVYFLVREVLPYLGPSWFRGSDCRSLCQIHCGFAYMSCLDLERMLAWETVFCAGYRQVYLVIVIL